MNIPSSSPSTLQTSLWRDRFLLFTRFMAFLCLIKGLIHWMYIVGIGDGPYSSFLAMPLAWRSATIYFAVTDLVAGVGLWLGATWGGIVWLLSMMSLAAVELMFPEVFGGRIVVILAIFVFIGLYIWIMASLYKSESSVR